MENNNVIQFDRPADFYYRMAQRLIDENKYIEALSVVRTAVEKEPDEYEYNLTLAEVLSEVTRFEESNRVIFKLIEEGKQIDSDAYFCLGCNFMGTGDFEKAKESFEKYLSLAPGGEYREEVENFFNFFEQDEFEAEIRLKDVNEEIVSKKAEQGKHLLDVGKYEDAIEVLENIDVNEPGYVFTKNNLALAYYCIGNINKAIEITDEVLQREPQTFTPTAICLCF